MERTISVKVVAKALVVWLAIVVSAIINGIIRESLLVPGLGSVHGLFVSGLLLSCLIMVVAYLALPWLGVRGNRQLLLLGLGWLVLTLVFEFSFGLARGKSLDELLAAYRFKGGNIWPLVLVVTVAAPWLASKLRKKGRKGK